MKTILITLAGLLLNIASFAQSKITGTVYGSGKPLEGATVKIKGEGSAISNSGGEFIIHSKANVTILSVSHVGYITKDIRTGGTAHLEIQLDTVLVTLKEVKVSTGYQEISKESVTGSFDKIDNKLYNRAPSSDVLSRLEGVASSAYFSKVGATGIFIRGMSTLTAGTSPLIVLDNFPYEGNINNINPNDVESVTILKDAAAASIWGAKAGNGVIVITTKKGKFGEKAGISFNSNYTIQGKPDLYKDAAFISAADFIDLERFLFAKGKYDADLSNTTSRPIVSPVVEILAKQRAGAITPTDADAQIDAYKNFDVRDDYTKYFYQTGSRQQYALGFTGGSAAINYIINGGYDNTISNMVGNSSNRATLYAATTIKPVKKLEMQLGINYASGKANNNSILPININAKSGFYPYAKFADSAGNALAVPFIYRNAYLDTAGGGLLLDWKYRPLDEMKARDNTSLSDDILLKLNLHYQVIKSLYAEISAQYEKSFTGTRNVNNLQSYHARNTINKYSQRSGTGIIRNVPLGGILDHSESRLSAYGIRGQLNYNGSWKNQELTAIAGTEVRQSHTFLQSATVYGYDDNILTTANVNNLSSFTFYGNLGSGVIPSNNSFREQVNRYVSFYSNAVYTLYKKYSISSSVRKDASNLFGVTTNQKWKPLYSAGMGWVLSAEKFYHVSALPFLKLRLTWGYNGNVRNNLAAIPTIRYSGVEPTTNLQTASVNTLPNPELRWEKVGMLNAGIDFAFINNRVEGSIEYFHKKGVDLLTSSPVDPTIGLSLMTLNTANITGQGVDIKLNCNILDKGCKVNAMLIFSYVTNRLTRYLINSNNKGSYPGLGTIISPIEGQDPFAMISYRWAGLDPLTGDPLGYLNGAISKDYTKITATTSLDDIVFQGTARPPYFANVLPSFSWKGITLSANISGKFGFYFRRNSLSYSSLFNGWLMNSEYTGRWQKPGDEQFTNVPSLVYPSVTNRDKFYNYSEATVEKGDFIKLQDINLSYEPSARFIKHLKNIQLYVYAANLGFLWRANKVGVDPEYGNSIPVPHTVTFGFKTTL